jgi:phosphoribosylamine--glycine ligase
MPTRIVVVGGGGREHALAWKLGAEPGVNEVIVVPGSDAIAAEPRVSRWAGIDPLDVAAVVSVARREAAELVVVGPEAPLAAGLADALEDAGFAVFGPTRAAAAIESSKTFCHEVAEAAGVRMAGWELCRTRAAAEHAIERLGMSGSGFVIKEDGLAGGKGVTVFGFGETPETEATTVLDRLFAETGDIAIVVEERLSGVEASVIAICDGTRAVALPAARDHKRLGDGDTGPNTGGMGAYSPLADLDDEAVDAILATIHVPILAELARRGTPFRGFLYAGLMVTPDGPALLECNARLGDPEAQVILPRLGAALGPVLLAAARGTLPAGLPSSLPTLPGAAVGVVLAGERYPAAHGTGDAIHGLEEARGLGALVFHAGTTQTNDGWVTNGGRILTVVGRGADLQAARALAETAADAITFRGVQRRHDIGAAPVGVATP